MKKFPDEYDLLDSAIGSLCNFTYDNDQDKNRIVLEGGVTTIMDAMKRHADRSDLQLRSCLALGNLSIILDNDENKPPPSEYVYCGDEEIWHACEQRRRDIATGPTVPSCIVMAVRNHSEDTDLATEACRALMNFSFHENSAAALVAADGVKCVVQAMKSFPTNEFVQDTGCGFIDNISSQSDYKLSCLEAGAIPVLVKAMKLHPDSLELLTSACGALHSLLSLGDAAVHQMVVAGGITCMAVTAQTHFSNDNLREKVRDIMTRLLPSQTGGRRKPEPTIVNHSNNDG